MNLNISRNYNIAQIRLQEKIKTTHFRFNLHSEVSSLKSIIFTY